jgi:hypothetical protein
MKKLVLMLLLAAPVLFSSCSKEETTIGGNDPFANMVFDKRLSVSKSDLLKFEVMRTLDNDKYEFIVFKSNVAGVLTTDLNNVPKTYVYCPEWGISNDNLTFVPENGSPVSYAISKEYKKISANSYTITVYLKDGNGKEAAYDVVDDGSNHSSAIEIWNVINTSRNNQE